jgi:hypothetical protein
MMDVDDDGQSCEEDSFECVCGEEKCTCRAPEAKRRRPSDIVEMATIAKTDPMTVEDAPITDRPECHFRNGMMMIQKVISKFYDFIDCTPPDSTTDAARLANPTEQTTAAPKPTEKPPCHGLGIMKFLSSSSYASQLQSRGFCKKFHPPCSKFTKKE